MDAGFILQRYATAEKVAYTLRRPLFTGRSRRPAAVVMERNPRGETRNLVLSVGPLPDGMDEVDVLARYDEAWVTAPEFAAAHLTALAVPPLRASDGRLLLLQRFSDGMRRNLHPLNEELRGGVLGRGTDTRRTADPASRFAGVVGSLLGGWNKEPTCVEMSVLDLLGRCGGGSIEFDPSSNRAFPVLVGNVHGNLHGGSLLIAPHGGAHVTDYWLTDLVVYSHSSPVVQDPVSLVVSVVAAELAGLVPTQRDALAGQLVGDDGHGGPSWLFGLIAAVHRTTRAWAGEFCSAEAWRRQELLCLAGCAMSAARDATDDADRLWWLAVAERAVTAHEEIAEPDPVGSAAARRSGYSGQLKVSVCRRLHADWQEVADLCEIPPYDRRTFERGREPQGVWEWLESRGRLSELPDVLLVLGRLDLVGELAADADGTMPT
ncbi:MAG TPA: hypothetical protein VGL06_09715 [Pseudonocardiaceae bacterium]